MTAQSWVVDIDGREDGGPTLLGPFPSRASAGHWSEQHVPTFTNGGVISWEVRCMTSISEGDPQ